MQCKCKILIVMCAAVCREESPPEVSLPRSLYPHSHPVGGNLGWVEERAPEAGKLVDAITRVTDDMLARFESRMEGRMRLFMDAASVSHDSHMCVCVLLHW